MRSLSAFAHHQLTLGPENNLLQGIGEVGHGHLLVVAPGRHQGRLVYKVAQVRPHHSRRGGGNRGEVDIFGQRDSAGMHLQDHQSAPLVGWAHRDMAVEAARAQQRRIEDFGPVGSGDHDHAFGAGEAVHLGQDLVKGLFPLVVTAHRNAPTAGACR